MAGRIRTMMCGGRRAGAWPAARLPRRPSASRLAARRREQNRLPSSATVAAGWNHPHLGDLRALLLSTQLVSRRMREVTMAQPAAELLDAGLPRGRGTGWAAGPAARKWPAFPSSGPPVTWRFARQNETGDLSVTPVHLGCCCHRGGHRHTSSRSRVPAPDRNLIKQQARVPRMAEAPREGRRRGAELSGVYKPAWGSAQHCNFPIRAGEARPEHLRVGRIWPDLHLWQSTCSGGTNNQMDEPNKKANFNHRHAGLMKTTSR